MWEKAGGVAAPKKKVAGGVSAEGWAWGGVAGRRWHRPRHSAAQACGHVAAGEAATLHKKVGVGGAAGRVQPRRGACAAPGRGPPPQTAIWKTVGWVAARKKQLAVGVSAESWGGAGWRGGDGTAPATEPLTLSGTRRPDPSWWSTATASVPPERAGVWKAAGGVVASNKMVAVGETTEGWGGGEGGERMAQPPPLSRPCLRPRCRRQAMWRRSTRWLPWVEHQTGEGVRADAVSAELGWLLRQKGWLWKGMECRRASHFS